MLKPVKCHLLNHWGRAVADWEDSFFPSAGESKHTYWSDRSVKTNVSHTFLGKGQGTAQESRECLRSINSSFTYITGC